MLKSILSFLALSACLAASVPASAHFYAYRDPDYKIDLAYPDSWKAQGGLPGDGIYKMTGSSVADAKGVKADDQAQCLVFAKQDARYTMYPRDYVEDILAQEMQWSYWEQAVAQYDDLYFYYDNFGALGGSPARYTLVDYVDHTRKEGVRKRAWVYGAIAGDLHVNVHCSSTLDSFEAHADDFAQIIDSVKFPPPYATTYRGGYRDFLNRKKSSAWANTVGPLLVYLLPRSPLQRIVHCPKNLEYPACLFKPKRRQIPTR